MRYLLGDSSDSGLDFNYLAFLREVIDVAVVLVEHDVLRANVGERRRAKEQDNDAAGRAIEELGKKAAALVAPVIEEHGDAPLGRAARAMAAAAKEAVARELALLRAALTDQVGELAKDEQRVQKRALVAIEKLLKTHDLPDAAKTYEIQLGAPVKAQLRETTAYGAAATIALDVPASSPLASELRIDRLVDGIEVQGVEAGGWLKKSSRVVPHKLGRYVITRVVVGADVQIRARAGVDGSAQWFDVVVRDNGEVTVEKDFTIDDGVKPLVVQLAGKLRELANELDGHRGALVTFELERKPFLEHANPVALADSLIAAVAPVVQKIAKHSRNPDELVLRRMLGDDRREEIFIATSELAKKLDPLPASARGVFAPLGILPVSPRRPTLPPPAQITPPGPPPPPPARAKSETIDLEHDAVELVASADVLAAKDGKRAPAVIVAEADEPGSAPIPSPPADFLRRSDRVTVPVETAITQAIDAALDAALDER